jgi:hypothetical protein
MTASTLDILSYLSVLFPLVMAIYAWNKATRDYLPFFYFVFLVAVCDLISTYFILFPSSKPNFIWGMSRSINALGEPLFIMWIYHRWELFHNKKKLYNFLLVLWPIAWLIEILYFKTFYKDKIYLVTLYDFICVLLTIAMLDKMMTASKTPLNQNARFFICAGFLVYLFGQTIPVLFSFKYLRMSSHFRMQMVHLANLFVTTMYLLFAYALILIVRQDKQRKHGNIRTNIY